MISKLKKKYLTFKPFRIAFGVLFLEKHIIRVFMFDLNAIIYPYVMLFMNLCNKT